MSRNDAAQWALVGDASVAFKVRRSGPALVEVPNGSGVIWSDHPLTRAWPERVQEFARFLSYVVSEAATHAAIGAAIPTIDIGVKHLRGIPGQWRLSMLDLEH